MIGIGTMVNAIAVILGGIIGCLFRKGLPHSYQEGIMRAVGLAIVFMGVQASISIMMGLEDSSLLIVVSLSVGAAIGECLGIESWFESLGNWLRKKFSNSKDNQFLVGFLNTSLTICIGAMAIVGSMEDGIYHNYSMLYTKAILDFIIVIMMASLYGKGTIFSVIPLVIIQGSITLLASLLGSFMSTAMITNISLIGNMLIACVGLNLLLNAKIKVANLLPALLICVLFAL